MDQTNVVGVDVMTDDIENLISANKILVQDVLSNDSFSLEDKECIRDRLQTLTEQLYFWTERDNKYKFCEELKNHINWMLNNYS